MTLAGPLEVLALSGSLRTASLNSALLRAAAEEAPSPMPVRIARPGALPLFNPDLESRPPDAVRAFHGEVARAGALLIASPEYAHGVTGVIKNALDWLVSFEPFVGKPVALINASGRARHADAALREVLVTMSARIVEPASPTIPLHPSDLDANGRLLSARARIAIRDALTALFDDLKGRGPTRGPDFRLG